jgi:hypothetical protein
VTDASVHCGILSDASHSRVAILRYDKRGASRRTCQEAGAVLLGADGFVPRDAADAAGSILGSEYAPNSEHHVNRRANAEINGLHSRSAKS